MSEIEFYNGNYSYSDISNYIKESLKDHGHYENVINISFVLSPYKVVIELKDDYWLDLRGPEFNKLLGFDKKIVKQTEYGARLPDITNSLYVLYINTDVISDSLVDGIATNTLCTIPVDNLTRSLPTSYKLYHK